MNNERLDRLNGLLQQRPDDPFLRYAQLLEFIRLERTEDALDVLQTLLQQHPDYLGTYYTGARFLHAQQQPDSAADLYRRGLALARRLGEHKTAAELQAALDLMDP